MDSHNPMVKCSFDSISRGLAPKKKYFDEDLQPPIHILGAEHSEEKTVLSQVQLLPPPPPNQSSCFPIILNFSLKQYSSAEGPSKFPSLYCGSPQSRMLAKKTLLLIVRLLSKAEVLLSVGGVSAQSDSSNYKAFTFTCDLHTHPCCWCYIGQQISHSHQTEFVTVEAGGRVFATFHLASLASQK